MTSAGIGRLGAFVAGAGRTQLVEAQPPGDDGEPASNVVDLADIGSGQPQERLLSDVLGLADVAEHLIGEVHQVGAMAAPCRLIGGDCGHALTTRQRHRKVTGFRIVTFPVVAPSLVA